MVILKLDTIFLVYIFYGFFPVFRTTFVIERKNLLKNHLDSSRPKGSQTVKRGRMSVAQENNSFQKADPGPRVSADRFGG